MNIEFDIRYLDRLALYLGLACMGAAMAFALALALLQDAAISAGALPEPGTIAGEAYKTSPLWHAATTLQQLANGSGVLGAALLLVGAWRDRQTEDAEVAA